MRTKAFTLIELLIVVAIIAILAAIAVPNFLEAQTRSKISRSKADMRSMATALEAYYIDYNKYPYDGYNRIDTDKYNYWFVPIDISTPVAYMTTAKLVDPFRKDKPSGTRHWQWDDVRYRNTEATWGTQFDEIQTTAPGQSSYFDEMMQDQGGWSLICNGPDYYYGPPSSAFPAGTISWPTDSGYPAHTQPYDPTNGTVSWGDILRTQINPEGLVNVR